MKKIYLFLIVIVISCQGMAQIPAEEATLAARYATACNVDYYLDSDKSIAWIFEVIPDGGRTFKFQATGRLIGSHYLVAYGQSGLPFERVIPAQFIFKNNPDLLGGEMFMKLSPLGELRSINNNVQLYRRVVLYKKIRVKRRSNLNKQYLEGVVSWRTNTDTSEGPLRKYEFLLRFGVPKD